MQRWLYILITLALFAVGVWLVASVSDKFNSVSKAPEENKKTSVPTQKEPGEQSFANEVFLLSKFFDENECKTVAQCDCCASDLFFLNSRQFVMVSRCLYNDTYFSGTYSITERNLALTFSQKSVVEKIEEETNEISYETAMQKIGNIEFIIDFCQEHIKVHNSTIKEFTNGSKYDSKTATELLNSLKSNQVFKLLAI
ncbi:MAG: hypothetical protein ACK514_09550 [Bacteroidota bacterium]|jgi:hypothetical protein|nr:hypothetical protein [Cytophagales bacterium]MCE2956486.1 hypothetical protein [Flammeovirgaceae bacterium]MCZ8070229.1 hypothetical protein [Cytophagales bacterium]